MSRRYLPKSVLVFGRPYTIKLCHPVHDDNGNEVSGTTDNSKQIIELDSKQSKDELLHTLVHELGHAMVYRTSISQTELHGEVEEVLVNNWATLMTEIFDLRIKRK